MKYLEVEGAGRPEAEGRRHRAARRGKEDRSPMPNVFWFWSSSLRTDVMCSSCRCRWLLSLRPDLHYCWLLSLMCSVLVLLYFFFFFFFERSQLLPDMDHRGYWSIMVLMVSAGSVFVMLTHLSLSRLDPLPPFSTFYSKFQWHKQDKEKENGAIHIKLLCQEWISILFN